ncbi:uncharacterized protein LOC129874396 [Solanum dulcamara]|uniref:uncharacterized protein LOC129874396 n=1 Tax=Solanum dulcamara TaxID=45834 RepID=UPI002486C162|nr:uncharacterized protein LOC129874396 [Solanum dulcamara]
MALFADTNLGTRIVVLVSPYTTPNHFKREVERAHLNCFPQLGQIKVDAVMVERNSCFYHLPETLPLKHVLKGFRPLVHVRVCQYSILKGFSTISGPMKLKTCTAGPKVEKLKCRRKLKKMKRFACLKGAFLRIVHLKKRKKKKRNKGRKAYKFKCLEGPDEPLVVSMAYGCEGKEQSSDLSEAVSVSGIIRKYFSSHDEVNSHALLSPFPAETPSDQSANRASITNSKSKRIEIGSRIVSASKSLSSLPSRRLLPSPAPLIPSLVFEISDED